MGYRSEVRVVTTLEGFEAMQEIAFKIAEKEGIANDMTLFPVAGQDPDAFFDFYDAQEDYLCFGFDWVKWYNNYKDVSLFMKTLEVANERGVDWQFIRIGEEFGDVEDFSSDDFYNNSPSIILYPRVEIDYCYCQKEIK